MGTFIIVAIVVLLIFGGFTNVLETLSELKRKQRRQG